MKAVQNFGMMYILMVVGQMFICNYFHLPCCIYTAGSVWVYNIV